MSSVTSSSEQYGWISIEQADPDCWVVTHASVEGQTRIDVDSFGYAGYGWRGWRGWHRYPGYGTTSVNVREVDVGTLVLEILDGDSKELVWRAGGTGHVTTNPKKRDKRLTKGAAKMFRRFPPQ